MGRSRTATGSPSPAIATSTTTFSNAPFVPNTASTFAERVALCGFLVDQYLEQHPDD
jgi:hypothetical protein